MTTELEKQFFETFGIEPKHNDGCILSDLYEKNKKQISLSYDAFIKKNCTEGDSGLCYSTCPYAYDDVEYPIITDTHYLELLCMLGKYNENYSFNNVKKLKETVLKDLIKNYKWVVEADFKSSDEWAEELKTKIQALFKGE